MDQVDHTQFAHAMKRCSAEARLLRTTRRRSAYIMIAGVHRASRHTYRTGLEYVVTVTLIVADIARSTAFYRDVLGAEVLLVDEPTLLRLGNVWLTINVGGGPTDDKPEVIATAPRHFDELTLFLNLRVTDIKRFYQRCRARGAVFVTEPKVHPSELRCYIRDPDGYLIEVGQTTDTKTPLEMYT